MIRAAEATLARRPAYIGMTSHATTPQPTGTGWRPAETAQPAPKPDAAGAAKPSGAPSDARQETETAAGGQTPDA